METTAAFDGLVCRACGARPAPASGVGRCPACGGPLSAAYDLDAVSTDLLDAGPRGSMWRFGELLPFEPTVAVSAGEGGTALVECPSLAGELDVERVLIKDEGGNPTGSVAARELSVAVTAAAGSGAAAVALPSPGNDGHAAAAYAARAALDAHVFVPSRAGFVQKAMINVHGGDMSVVEGRLDAAVAAWAGAMDAHADWQPVAPGASPYRVEGYKTVLYEVVADLGEVPEAVVVPTGSGVAPVALWIAATELRDLGLIETTPRLYAAQAAGCAPIVEAADAGAPVEPWDRPDTICADLEVAEPPMGEAAVDAVRESGGGGVATDDDAVLESAVTIAEHEGLAVSPAGGAAASGAWTLAERDAFAAEDTVVLVNPAAGAKAADVLRSHLMGQGV